MRRPSRRALREAIEKTSGVVVALARNYEVSRKTIYTWLDHYELHDAMRDARDDVTDIAEANIIRQIRAGEVSISQWYLTNSRSGRNRGYGRRTELTGADGQPLFIPPEVQEAMRKLDLDMSEVNREFNNMILAAAANMEKVDAE